MSLPGIESRSPEPLVNSNNYANVWWKKKLQYNKFLTINKRNLQEIEEGQNVE